MLRSGNASMEEMKAVERARAISPSNVIELQMLIPYSLDFSLMIIVWYIVFTICEGDSLMRELTKFNEALSIKGVAA